MENVGAGDLSLPQNEMHTTSYWLTIPSELFQSLPFSSEEKINGLFGLAYCLHHVAPLFMMCDIHDVGVSVGDNTTGKSLPPRGLPQRVPDEGEPLDFSDIEFEPNIFIYDNFPGGIGLSPSLFDLEKELLERCQKTIVACPCREGCPSCVGPTKESGKRSKQAALEILQNLL
jgi:DEAD/DEAH box helicase domain-containing protein